MIGMARVCSCPWQSWQGSADRLSSSDACAVFQNFLTVLFMIRKSECEIHAILKSPSESMKHE